MPIRFAPEWSICVLLVPPQAIPVTVPLGPEFVPPIDSRNDAGPVVKPVSEAKRKIELVAPAPGVAEKFSLFAAQWRCRGTVCSATRRRSR